MKVSVNINPELLEDCVTFNVKELTDKIKDMMAHITSNEQTKDRVTVKKDDAFYPILITDIYRIVIEDKAILVKTAEETYRTKLRLYQLKELLGKDFLQISQSEMINVSFLSHLELQFNGLVKLVMKNGDYTYSSRRYLKVIKEALGL